MIEATSSTTRVPIKGLRKMISTKMTKSLEESAQLTFHAEVNLENLIGLKKALEKKGERVSLQDLMHFFIIKTICNHPDLNGHKVNDEVCYFEDVNLSFAYSPPGGGLITPTIFAAQTKSLDELRLERVALSNKAMQGLLKPSEYTGGTITISNLGLTRVKGFTPILNSPQLAIIGIGGASERLVFDKNNKVVAATFSTLSLTIDHCVIDGLPAANFLSGLCMRIEEGKVD